MQNRFQKFPNPHRHPPTAVYRVVKPLTVNGVKLAPGDLLPADSPIRQNPQRLMVLCRIRALAAVTQVAVIPPAAPQPAPAVEPATPAAAAETAMDISKMTGRQLVRACRERGLNVSGNNSQLRKRLRTVLG